MAVNNLNQLKKHLRAGSRFEITAHRKPEYIGQVRKVTLANTQGFYSAVDGQPNHAISKANGGRGSWLDWNKAPVWSFQDGVCVVYRKNVEHTEQNIIMAFCILEKEAA